MHPTRSTAAGRTLAALTLLWLVGQASHCAAQATATSAPLTYEADIGPIMEAHCTGCHGWWFPKKSLRLDSRENMLKGGASGPAIVPGDPSKGWLMRLVRKETAGAKIMPPQGSTPLREDQIRLIEEWIRQGAR